MDDRAAARQLAEDVPEATARPLTEHLPKAAAQADAPGAPPPLVALDGITKVYGSTWANRDVTFRVSPGEVVGLIGANGAGKSTLMRVLTGGTEPDAGRLVFAGEPVAWSQLGARACHRMGIRIVHQELSLCPNLTAAENFFLEQPEQGRPSPVWLGPYRRAVRESMAEVFPGARVDPDARVGRLDIGERQMLEIARAAHDPRLRLLILDEPTSSLSSDQARALHAYVARRAADGLAVIFISHRLHEVLGVADRVVAMRNGAVVSDRARAEVTLDDLIEAVGGRAALAQASEAAAGADGAVLVRLSGTLTAPLGRPVELRAGEVVGLAGLEGGGQKALLRRLFAPSAARRGGEAARTGRATFVSGDRRGEGVFPLWSVFDNVAIGRIARQPSLARVRLGAERAAATAGAERLSLAPERLPDPILDLSGGNQQKALLARGMVGDAPIVLLDDPTRGVDIGAKRDFYRVLRDVAQEGRLAIWHSTEDAELLECDRVLVLSQGRIVADLAGAAVTEEAIIGHGFTEAEPGAEARRRGLFTPERVFEAIPFLGLALLVALMASRNPLVLSSFGMQLLLAPAVVLVLIALAQMFVVGGSEIDLGVGGFVSMVNVISATILVSRPDLGGAMLAGGLVGYALLAVLIQTRGIPAIVVTLGASFIWVGIGRTIQPSPGGSAPEWLPNLFDWTIPGLPTPLTLILVAGLVAFALNRSPLGVVLRGFGSAPEALARLGWSPLRYAVWRYLIAGSFAMTAGLYLTAINNASDINVGSAYTLLSVAGIVIGGCALLGGVISPLGVVAGAVTLALIGAALAMLGVGTDYNALVQGSLLILILGLRTLLGWRQGDAR
jgi:ribose transport system ATP-binding protein